MLETPRKQPRATANFNFIPFFPILSGCINAMAKGHSCLRCRRFQRRYQNMGIHYGLSLLAQRALNGLNDATQVCEFVIFLARIAFDRVVPLILKQFSEQLVVMPAFVR